MDAEATAARSGELSGWRGKRRERERDELGEGEKEAGASRRPRRGFRGQGAATAKQEVAGVLGARHRAASGAGEEDDKGGRWAGPGVRLVGPGQRGLGWVLFFFLFLLLFLSVFFFFFCFAPIKIPEQF